MQAATDQRITELGNTLDTTISYLETVLETDWAARLQAIRTRIDTHPAAAIQTLLDAFEGHGDFNRLYLSGPRNGHSLSERQEIEANGKLHVLRTHLHALATDLARSSA